MERLEEQFSGYQVAPEAHYPSPLALPEALDYLNSVWQVGFGVPVFRVRRAEAAAKLGLTCGTSEEFEARLSALMSIFDHAAIPRSPNSSALNDLASFLHGHLNEVASERTTEAIEDLKAINDLRTWRQHPARNDRFDRGRKRLKVDLPPSDWNILWSAIQMKCIAALEAIREEVDAQQGQPNETWRPANP